MAANESLPELDDEFVLSGFIKLQGHIRGMLMRKTLQDIQKDYEEIVADIEEDVTVHWPSNALGLPMLKQKRDKKQIVPHVGDKSRSETDHLQDSPHFELPSYAYSSQNENCPSTFPTHTFHRHASNFRNENDKLIHELEENNEFIEKPLCAISPQSSHKATQITIEAQANVAEKQDLLCEALRDERTSNSCVSREVQTDLTKGVVDHQSDSTCIENHHENFTTEISAMQHLPEEMDVKSKSKMPKILCDKTNTKVIDSAESQIHYSAETNQVQMFTSSSPSNPLNTKLKDGLSNEIVPTAYCEDKAQAMIGLDEYNAEHIHITVENSVSAVTKIVAEEEDRIAYPNEECDQDEPEFNLPEEKDQLVKLKSTLAMELLWIEQAINSRKNYLRLKQQLS